jgi:hypothetical protein
VAGKLLSEMTKEELLAIMDECRILGERALRNGLVSEYQVQERRFYLARSYWLGPDFVELGRIYAVEGETTLFRVEFLRGVMAFGRVVGETQERGILTGMLVPPEFNTGNS